MGPREPSRASKTHKSAFAKTLKQFLVFQGFWGPRLPKTASKSPRRLPRGTQRAPKPEKNRTQKWTPKLLCFSPVLGPFWGPFWGQNWLQKGTKNGTTFGTPRPRISEVGELRFCKLNRSGGIAMATGIIFDKRKGGIFFYFFSRIPLKIPRFQYAPLACFKPGILVHLHLFTCLLL